MISMNRLLKEVEAEGYLVAPSSFSPLSARIVQELGYRAVHVSGNSFSGNQNLPDAGLITMTEMLENVRNISASVEIPIIADIDDGYGNALNVIRTVKLLSQAGASAVHMEDQEHPKKYSHYPGKRQLVPIETMVGKIKAAKMAADGKLLVIARTEGPGTGHTAVESIERLKAYADAGADAVLLISSEYDAFKLLKEKLPETLIAGTLNMDLMKQGKTVNDMRTAGCGIILVASIHTGLLHAAKAKWDSLTALKEHGTINGVQNHAMNLEQFYKIISANRYYEYEQDFVR